MLSKKQPKKKKLSPSKSKSKSRNKRFNTFTSSQFSMLDDRNYISSSVCDLFRNQFLKNRKLNNISVCSSRPPKKKIQQRVPVAKKKNPKKIKQKVKKQQFYQHIYLNPSNSHSQIIFSSQDTKRQSFLASQKDKDLNKSIINQPIKAVHKYHRSQLDSNMMLRINIKKQFQKKVDAAIKIQKVFRGYMTRKILSKYIAQEESNLKKRLKQFQGEPNNISDALGKSGEKNKIGFHGESDSFEDSYLSGFKNKSNNNLQSSDKISPSQFRMPKQTLIQQNLNFNDQERSLSQQDEQIVYRHQQPIYSHSQISHYLITSQQQSQEDGYQPDIIFQTNEQYIESKKNSLQSKKQPKNQLGKLSISEDGEIKYSGEPDRKKSQNIEKILMKNGDRKYSESEDRKYSNQKSIEYNKYENLNLKEQQSQKKQQQILNTEPTTEPVQSITQQNLPTMATMGKPLTETLQFHRPQNYSSRYKDQVIQYSFLKKSRQISNSSSSSLNKKPYEDNRMKKLKQTQKQRWEQVIQLVSKQVRQNQQKNIQMVHFMNSIIQMSKKNKQLLNQRENHQDQHQGYTTPTTIDNKIQSQEEDRKKQQENFENNQPKNDIQYRFRKKNLQIQIIEDDGTQNNQPKSLKKKSKQQTSFKKQQIKNKSPKHFPPKPCSIKPKQTIQVQQKQSDNKSQNNNSIQSQISISIKQQTNKLKNFLSNNMENDALKDMLRIRQELLQKRQSQMLIKLNKQLSQGQLTQDEFIRRLEELTDKFQEEKISIDKARADIQRGYKAAMILLKQTYQDARKLGVKMPISRSLGNLKYKNPIYIKNLIVDEIQCFTPQSIKMKSLEPKKLDIRNYQQEKSSQSQAQFGYLTQQQVERFKKIQSYDSQFMEMKKNITISDDFVKKHQQPNGKESRIQQQDQQSYDNIKISSQAYRQTYQIDDNQPIKTNPQIDSITNYQLQYLIYQLAIDITFKPILIQKLIDRAHLSIPKAITKEQQLLFIEIIQEYFPNKSVILKKLNQKIAPSPSQLLKYMRIDFLREDYQQQQSNDNDYQEVGKYQFVFQQQLCAISMIKFRQRIQHYQSKENQQENFQDINRYLGFEDRIVKYINQREKFIKNRKEQTKALRWEILNMQLHCLFNAWNEQLIHLRSQKPGFSGIGLNQLTLSIIDLNDEIDEKQMEKLLGKIMDRSDSVQRIQRQNYQSMCSNDSSWICYTDQALGYGLELTYVVQEEIFIEIAREIIQNHNIVNYLENISPQDLFFY